MLALALLLPACKDKCEEHPSAIEITLNASGDLRSRTKWLKVSVWGDIEKHQEYDVGQHLKDGSTSFVIYTGRPQGQSTNLTVDISATDESHTELGWAATTGLAQGNGCNFWTVPLTAGTRVDGIRDQGVDRARDLPLPGDGRPRDTRTIEPPPPPPCGAPAPSSNCEDRAASGFVNVWPTATDAPAKCTNYSTTQVPSTGTGAATWFLGLDCGTWKEYTVGPGCQLVLATRAECGPSCALDTIAYDVQEKTGSTWGKKDGRVYASCVTSGDCTTKTSFLAPDHLYAPQTAKIRVVAWAGFHLCVYSKSP